MDQITLEIKREHAFDLQSGVSSLRQDNFTSDFKVKVGETYISAHKAILASNSVFFRGLLTHDCEVLKKGFAELKDVAFEGVEQSIAFMYSGTADINTGNVQDIAYAAEMLQLSGLSRLCSNYLCLNLTLENCLAAKSLADLYNWDDLRTFSKKFVLDNFTSLISSGLVTSLEIEDLKLCLKSLNLKHDASWKIVIDWVKASPGERCSELLALLELLGVQHFPPAFLLETLLTEPLVIQSTSMKNFVLNILCSDLEKLKSILSPKNMCGIKEMLKESELPNTAEANLSILQFLKENFDSVIESDGYEDLPFEDVKLLCKSQDTKCSSEMTRWNLIVQWVKCIPERKKHFPELFKLVQLGRLTFHFVESDVRSEELMKGFPECQKYLASFLKAQDGNETESETQMIVLIPDNSHLHGLNYKQGIVTHRKLKGLPPQVFSNSQPSGKISSAEDRLILISGREFWELNGGGTWTKQGVILNQEVHVTNSTNILHHHGGILIFASQETILYDLVTRQISALPKCPLDPGLCSAGTKAHVYAVGGITTSKDAVALSCEDHPTVDALYCKNWQAIPGMRESRVHASATGFEKTVYVLGGTYAGNVLDSVEFYDEATNDWTFVQKMHVHRSHFGAFSCDKNIYAVGGDRGPLYAKHGSQSVEVYDIDSDRWKLSGAGFNLPGRVSVCKAPSCLAIKREEATVGKYGEETGVKQYDLVFHSKSIEKHLEGVTIAIDDNTFESMSDMQVTVNSYPDSIPSTWEPVTCDFSCRTTAIFKKTAEIYLFSSLTDSSKDLVTILQRSNDEWKPVGRKKPKKSRINLQINASCELIAVVPKSGRHKFSRQGIGSSNLRILDEPLPLDLEANVCGTHSADKGVPKASYSAISLKRSNSLEAQDVRKKRKESSIEDVDLAKEYQEAVKKPAKISQSIGVDGGEIRLHGCSLEFPCGAVKEEKEMTISVVNNPDSFPSNLEPIALILGFKPSMKFDKPVLVKMKTWFRAQEGENIPVVLSSRKKGSQWEKVGDVTVGSTNEVKFTVRHFCEIGLGVAPEQADNGVYTMHNDVYIQRETGQIVSSFYFDCKSEWDIWKSMRKNSFAVFSTISPLQISGRKEQKVSVKANITAPPDETIDGYPSREFQLQDALQRKQHNIIFVPNPRFGNYDGLIEGEYIIEIDGQEADKTLLARKWPVTLDPEDKSKRIFNIHINHSQVGTIEMGDQGQDQQ